MFAPYCTSHESRVLLPVTSIIRLESANDGMIAHFVCNCGNAGVWSTG